MSARPYHKRYHSDALAGFMSLTLEERGAYQTLLDMIYDRGGPVPDNERLLSGYMGCSLRKWRQVLDCLVAKGKIARTPDGKLTNRRAEIEIENDAKTARKLAENGSKGGTKRAENAKFGNENSDGEQATLKPRSSLPEARVRVEPNGSTAGAHTREADTPGSPVERQVIEAAGFTRPLSPDDRQQLARWRSDGIDLEGVVLPTLRRVAARQVERNKPIGTLRYCDQLVREEHATQRREVEHFHEVAQRYGAGANG